VILYILDINFFKKQSKIYLAITILVFIFGIIYELFSHDVYSYYMMFAFLIPFILGFIPSAILGWGKINKLPRRLTINICNAIIANLTIYSILKGVLEIYGTTNWLVNFYIYGIIVLIIMYILIKLKIKLKNNEIS